MYAIRSYYDDFDRHAIGQSGGQVRLQVARRSPQQHRQFETECGFGNALGAGDAETQQVQFDYVGGAEVQPGLKRRLGFEVRNNFV